LTPALAGALIVKACRWKTKPAADHACRVPRLGASTFRFGSVREAAINPGLRERPGKAGVVQAADSSIIGGVTAAAARGKGAEKPANSAKLQPPVLLPPRA
jgi:hypothetical protein